ncbi:MAG: hypothetical protein OEL87_02125 [Nanoarchaeota archaeon]|nr:hypothetical protein [Nanoarchaeota archaeon]
MSFKDYIPATGEKARNFYDKLNSIDVGKTTMKAAGGLALLVGLYGCPSDYGNAVLRDIGETYVTQAAASSAQKEFGPNQGTNVTVNNAQPSGGLRYANRGQDSKCSQEELESVRKIGYKDFIIKLKGRNSWILKKDNQFYKAQLKKTFDNGEIRKYITYETKDGQTKSFTRDKNFIEFFYSKECLVPALLGLE